jgi:hypothetical protein
MGQQLGLILVRAAGSLSRTLFSCYALPLPIKVSPI